MYDRKKLAGIAIGRKKWQDEEVATCLRKSPPRLERFSTVSDEEIDLLYTPDPLSNFDCEEDLGYPGEYPYTRGVQPTMYRGRLWTMRLFAGFGTPRRTRTRASSTSSSRGRPGSPSPSTCRRSWATTPTTRAPRARSARCGVAVDSLEDMEILFDGIPLDKVTTSMTINAPGGDRSSPSTSRSRRSRACPSDKVGGTIQNDILKEYIAQKAWIFPPEPVDAHHHRHHRPSAPSTCPQWNTISISGYHIREAGSTAVQELAFTLADGIAYVAGGDRRRARTSTNSRRGSRSSSTPTSTSSRRSPSSAPPGGSGRASCGSASARRTRARGCCASTPRPRACSLTAQQPKNNVVRVALQALAAVLGRHAVAAHQLDGRDARAADREGRDRSRCARSRSSPRRRASPTPSTRWAARTSWSS